MSVFSSFLFYFKDFDSEESRNLDPYTPEYKLSTLSSVYSLVCVVNILNLDDQKQYN